MPIPKSISEYKELYANAESNIKICSEPKRKHKIVKQSGGRRCVRLSRTEMLNKILTNKVRLFI